MRPLGFNLGTRNFTHLRCAPKAKHVTHLRTHGRVGGVGWDNHVDVPAHTQAQQPHHLSCCRADTGTAHDPSLAWIRPIHASRDTRQPWIAMLTCMYMSVHASLCIRACMPPCTHPWSSMQVFMSVCIFVSPVSESYVYVFMSVCMQVIAGRYAGM